jgi:hypothetical protein
VTAPTASPIAVPSALPAVSSAGSAAAAAACIPCRPGPFGAAPNLPARAALKASTEGPETCAVSMPAAVPRTSAPTLRTTATARSAFDRRTCCGPPNAIRSRIALAPWAGKAARTSDSGSPRSATLTLARALPHHLLGAHGRSDGGRTPMRMTRIAPA